MSDGVRKLVLFERDQWDRITRYRFDQQIESASEAVRRLVEIGLRSPREGESPTPPDNVRRRPKNAR